MPEPEPTNLIVNKLGPRQQFTFRGEEAITGDVHFDYTGDGPLVELIVHTYRGRYELVGDPDDEGYLTAEVRHFWARA